MTTPPKDPTQEALQALLDSLPSGHALTHLSNYEQQHITAIAKVYAGKVDAEKPEEVECV